ncbi:MAG TPA: ABC transporter ATP-binding protein [Steroidobacteraceae bacterium]|nr:ABC transporter ATP-binding protein [Steroidobacteraceae bacterium]
MRSTRATSERRAVGNVPALAIEGLEVSYATPSGERTVVRDLSLTIEPGECLGVVGESGAGKSQAFLAVLGLAPPSARVSGRVRLGPLEISGLKRRALDRVRGASVAMIFQDPASSLAPHLTVGDQVAEPIVRHRGASWREARRRALELLTRVQMNDPARRLDQYPHELSGGMRQRAMIAMALACDPQLLIADEPTTALDVTVQAQLLALLAELKRTRGMAIALITHDLAVVAGLADRVAILQAGRIIESGPVTRIFATPSHPHTRALLEAARAAPEPRAGRSSLGTVLEIGRLDVEYPLRRARVLKALSHVSFELSRGETLGIVGESGCGKSTLVRAVLQLVRPAAGTVVWAGQPLERLSQAKLRPLRRDLQIVFQDPLDSLDPRMTVAEIVAEPLAIHRASSGLPERARTVREMLIRVGLPSDAAARFPHELSGGQCQRVAIARAMILEPRLLVCDEPVSALDVSIRTQILELIRSLQRASGTSVLFVTHDLEVVRELCERVLVLYLGHSMEMASAPELYEAPLHPYTRALLAAVPVADPAVQPGRLRSVLGGEPPSAAEPPSGCVFRTRCPHALPLCAERAPVWELAGERRVACHRWRELAP